MSLNSQYKMQASFSEIALTKLIYSERKGRAASEPWTCVHWPSSTYDRLALTRPGSDGWVWFGPRHPTLHSPALSTGITQHTGVMWGLVTGHWSGRGVMESDLPAPANRSEHPWHLLPLSVCCVCYHQVFKQQNSVSGHHIISITKQHQNISIKSLHSNTYHL